MPARASPARAQAKPAAAAVNVVPNSDLLVKPVPASWVEGTDYSKATSVNPGDLVVVNGPSGLFFGTVEKKTGLPWQNTYSIIVQVARFRVSGCAREGGYVRTCVCVRMFVYFLFCNTCRRRGR